jgi:serine/threonine protein kinase
MSRGLRRTPLSIDINESAGHEESFIANGDVFIKDNVAINKSGIAMRDNPKTFTLVYDEIEMGDMIGRGCSSIVLHGVHAPTNTPLALKIINLFDKSKREQLIREIITLYDAQCPNLITFYGAFYREGINFDRGILYALICFVFNSAITIEKLNL